MPLRLLTPGRAGEGQRVLGLAQPPVVAPPGHGGTPPGHGGTPPGRSVVPPGRAGGVALVPAVADPSGGGLVAIAALGSGSVPQSAVVVPVAFIQAVASQGFDASNHARKTMPTLTITGGSTVIFGAAIYPAGATVSSISDGLGNVYTPAGAGLTGADGVHMQIYYAKNVTGGACTIVVTSGGLDFQSFCVWAVHEVQGLNVVAPLDQAGYNSGNTSGVDAATSGSVTTTAGGEYIFGFCEADGVTPAAGTGFTSRTTIGQGSLVLGERSEDLLQSAAGPIAATFTLGAASPYVAGIATFKA